MVTNPGNRPASHYNRNANTATTRTHETQPIVAFRNSEDVEIVVELVVIDGPEGVTLQKLQATAVRRVLLALLHSAPPSAALGSTPDKEGGPR
jgi:hypothetical protein